ncbi:complement C1r-A subcomponent-like protein [Lates japonicus]|uniref:Complement C1r-A subcomponent-like protein n=1 Tax=Lates japonicus TaxID=270547 RepID=A0AAD3MT10_LATJO|nr:complement C1r-A subcomponent-like protein [Lates japonicus]
MGNVFLQFMFAFILAKTNKDENTGVCESSLHPDSDPVIHGEVQSPQYPQPYPPNLLKQWELLGPQGYQIQLSITHLDIKASAGCHQDSLTVLYDQKVIGKFCGQENSPDHPGKELILSPGNRLTLIFQTSNSSPELQQHVGFSATYKGIVIDCGDPEPLLNGGVTFLSGFRNRYGSVVQYHCNEPFYSPLGGVNVTFTCEADGKWKSNHNSVVTPTCLPVCGQPTKQLSVFERVIGGDDAPDDTMPWQVLLNIDGGRGGGMVIADRWIMTTAHVVKNRGITAPPETVRIYMGRTNVETLIDSPIKAASVHPHPAHNNSNKIDYNNDIALIKLQDPITFNSSIMPICLPAKDATYIAGMMG